jgi:hypothetical protein
MDGYKLDMKSLIKGVFGSAVFIYVGYLVSGVLGYVRVDEMSYSEAFSTVFKSPFGSYFNEYSPVTMILGFIIFEAVYFYILMRRRSEAEYVQDDKYEPDILDSAARAGLDNPETYETSRKDRDMFSDIINRQDNRQNRAYSESRSYEPQIEEPQQTSRDYQPQSSAESSESDKQEQYSFTDEVVTDLLNDFKYEQIRAMLPMAKYIKDVSASALRKLFRPDMSADEISDYIVMFYG